MNKFETAKNCILNSDYNTALSILSGLKLNGFDYNVWFELSKLYFLLDDRKKCLDLLYELIDRGNITKDVSEMLLKLNSFADKKYTDIVLQKAELLFANDKDLILEISKYFLNNKDNVKAIEYLNKYLDCGGYDSDAIILLSKLYLTEGDIKNSEIILEKVEFNSIPLISFVDNYILKNDYDTGSRHFENICKAIEKSSVNEKNYLIIKIIERIFVSKINDNLNPAEKLKWIDLLYKYLKQFRIEDTLEIIKKIALFYKQNNNLYKAFMIMSDIAASDKVDIDFFKILCSVLREIDFTEKQKAEAEQRLSEIIDCIKDLKFKNIILNEIEILQKKTELKSSPRQMQVLLTTNCNIRCIMCNVCKESYIINDVFLEIVNKYMPYLEKIMWTGGEVLIYKNFAELINKAAEYNIQQSFITNGLLLNEKWLDLIGKYNISFAVSVDAAEKELYEKIRKGADFDILSKNLKMISEYSTKKKKLDYKLAFVAMSVNFEQIDKIVEFAVSYGFNAVLFQEYISYGNDLLALNEEQKKIVVKKIKYYKNKSDKGEIPLHIVTKYNLNIDDGDFTVENNNGENSINEICIEENTECNDIRNGSEKTDNICDKNIEYGNENISEENKKEIVCSKLKCVAPWESLFFGPNCIHFSSYCRVLKTQNKDIWNSEEVKDYRKFMIDGNVLDECNKCEQMGDIAENGRTGKK